METIRCRKVIYSGSINYKITGYNFYYMPPHSIMYETILLPTDISSDFYICMPEDAATDIIIKNENHKQLYKVLEKNEDWSRIRPYIYEITYNNYL